MKFSSAFVLVLAGVAAAKNKNSTESQCKQVQKLQHLTELAANTTKLDKITDGNATKVAEIQAKASAGATKLQTLESNTTLMSACSTIFAAQDTLDDCDTMSSLEKVMTIANNATLLAKHTKNNATKATEFQAKASAKAADLKTLQANTTLTAICAAEDEKSTCKKVAKLAKEQALSKNTTALNDKFKGDATKISNYQAKVSEKATKLNALTSNSTLMDTCQSLGITTAAATTSDSSSSSSSSKTKSAGVAVSSMGGAQVLAMVSALAFTMFML